jgi:hypothetical protein
LEQKGNNNGNGNVPPKNNLIVDITLPYDASEYYLQGILAHVLPNGKNIVPFEYNTLTGSFTASECECNKITLYPMPDNQTSSDSNGFPAFLIDKKVRISSIDTDNDLTMSLCNVSDNIIFENALSIPCNNYYMNEENDPLGGPGYDLVGLTNRPSCKSDVGSGIVVTRNLTMPISGTYDGTDVDSSYFIKHNNKYFGVQLNGGFKVMLQDDPHPFFVQKAGNFDPVETFCPPEFSEALWKL